jgi:hypothetical protein
MKIPMATLVFVCTLAGAFSPAFAESTYTDADSEYLKFSSFFIEPVGRLLEWVIFRPVHTVHHWVSPAETLDGRPVRECTGLRPRRDCARD